MVAAVLRPDKGMCRSSWQGPLQLKALPSSISYYVSQREALLSYTTRTKTCNLIENVEQHRTQTDTFLQGSKNSGDSVEFIPLLYAWAPEETIEGAQEAQNILDQLKQKGHALMMKNYTIVMDACGWAGQPSHTEAVYGQLMVAYNQHKTEQLAPNNITWNVLLVAHIRARNTCHAKTWLEHMEQHEMVLQSDMNIAPQTSNYNLLLSAYAQGKMPPFHQTHGGLLQMIPASSTGWQCCLCSQFAVI